MYDTEAVDLVVDRLFLDHYVDDSLPSVIRETVLYSLIYKTYVGRDEFLSFFFEVFTL
jgi:hypothetical protein